MDQDTESLPDAPPRWRALCLVLACVWIISIGLWDSLVLSQGEMPPPPSRDSVQGFECGVRYGVIVAKLEPEEDDLTVLTSMAKSLHALITKHAGTEAMACPQDATR